MTFNRYSANSAANVTGGNMTAGGNITNITTGGGGNMTAGENKLTSQIFLIDISFPSRHARGVTVMVKMAIWG